jgi:phosphatidylserine/phosphatidylglycerophosphate/cardiolipin synthase-like enzyme
MRRVLDVRTLTDGGQRPLDVAREVADFVGVAERSLDFAHYDFHLSPEPAEIVAATVRDAAARGVAVRFLYNLDHRNPIPVPPPPEPDGILIESLGVPVRAIAGVPDLMHHKFVVRDGTSVWTGSTNWTDESWSRQENVVAVAESRELGARFTEDFEQLWRTGAVEQSGFVDTTPVPVGDLQVRPWFTPGHGEGLSHRIGKTIAKAQRRVRIASPVITAAPSWPASAKWSRRAASTSPAASTGLRSTASSTSGAKTATSRGSCRSSSASWPHRSRRSRRRRGRRRGASRTSCTRS